MITREEAFEIVQKAYPTKKIEGSCETPNHYCFSVRLFTPKLGIQFGDVVWVEVHKELGVIDDSAECEMLKIFFPEEYKEVQKTIIRYEGDSK